MTDHRANAQASHEGVDATYRPFQLGKVRMTPSAVRPVSPSASRPMPSVAVRIEGDPHSPQSRQRSGHPVACPSRPEISRIARRHRRCSSGPEATHTLPATVRTSASALLGALLVFACSSQTTSANTKSDAPTGTTDDNPQAEAPSSSDGGTPDTQDEPPAPPPPERPEPQPTVRDCGHSFGTAQALGRYTQWFSFKATKLGAQAIPTTQGRALFDEPWAQGSPSRLTVATSGGIISKADAVAAEVRAVLGMRETSDLEAGTFFNASTPNGSSANLFYTDPSAQILTYVNAWGLQEVGWTLNAPQRTAATGNVDDDLFVRTLIPGRFIAFEIALLFPDSCSVGALSDALGKPALIRNAADDSGIFAPSTMQAAQDVLVKNGVKMQIRVASNKPITEIDALMASTTCSPGNLAACKTLLASLNDESDARKSATTPSTLEMLENGTDPQWTTIEVATSEVKILLP